ncbi:MAG: CPBP family intramembrane glutamic endopeptidase [Bacilli bacterium]
MALSVMFVIYFVSGISLAIMGNLLTNRILIITSSFLSTAITFIVIRKFYFNFYSGAIDELGLVFRIGWIKTIFAGFLFGMLGVLISFYLGVLFKTIDISHIKIKSHAILYSIQYLFVAMNVGLSEELIYRGFVQNAFEKYLSSFWSCAIFTTILFDAAHFTLNIPSLLVISIFGLLVSYLKKITGGLWMSIGFHVAWDWALITFGISYSGYRYFPASITVDVVNYKYETILSFFSLTALFVVVFILYRYVQKRQHVTS